MKFRVLATEKVFYEKVVEAVDEVDLEVKIRDGEIDFVNSDIVDGTDFQVTDYEVEE